MRHVWSFTVVGLVVALATTSVLLYRARAELGMVQPRADAHVRHCRMVELRLQTLHDDLDNVELVESVQRQFLAFQHDLWQFVTASQCVPDTIMRSSLKCVPLSVLLDTSPGVERQIDPKCIRAELTRLLNAVGLDQ